MAEIVEAMDSCLFQAHGLGTCHIWTNKGGQEIVAWKGRDKSMCGRNSENSKCILKNGQEHMSHHQDWKVGQWDKETEAETSMAQLQTGGSAPSKDDIS